MWTESSWTFPESYTTGVIKFWGPHAIGAPLRLGPPCPILPVGWGHRRELGAPHTFLTDSSVRLQDGRSVSVSMPVSVFGYKTSAEHAESSMYHGGDREGKLIY